MIRPTISDGPPGVFATMILTGRSGYAAKAERVRRITGAATPAASAPLIMVRRVGIERPFDVVICPPLNFGNIF